MPQQSTSIRSRRLLNVLAVISILALTALVFYSPSLSREYHAWRYRTNHDQKSLGVILKTLRNGDSVEHVERLLGPAPRTQDPSYRKFCAEIMSRDPQGAPMGFQETDELLRYKTRTATIHLQFRDGRLVNHDPTISPFLEHSLM